MDIEDEKESSSGLIYILHSKRLARLVRGERGAEGGEEVDREREMTRVDTSTVTLLHTIPLSLQITDLKLGARPLHTQCPHCAFYIVTKTESEPGLLVCLSSSLLCCLGWDISVDGSKANPLVPAAVSAPSLPKSPKSSLNLN